MTNVAATNLGQVRIFIDNGWTIAQFVIALVVTIVICIALGMAYRAGNANQLVAVSVVGIVLIIGVWIVWPTTNPPRTCASPVDSPKTVCGPPILEDGRELVLEGDHRYQAGVINDQVVNITAAQLAAQGILTGRVDDWTQW